MIEIKDLHISYGNEVALDKVNLNIERNTTCAIIGPSGCGKTTLLYSIAGLIKPNKGTIYINGKELNNIRKHRSNIAELWITSMENSMEQCFIYFVG